MVSKDRHENAIGQTWQPSFANKVSSVAYEERPTNPSTQNMVSHSLTLGCLLRASHRATDQKVVWTSRDREGPLPEGPKSFGSFPWMPIGRAAITAIFNLLRMLVDPPFVAFTQKTTFGRSISRHVTCFRLRVPRTQTPAFLDSAAFCVILDMRFQSRRCGYSCMITNANFLCKHYAIALLDTNSVHISTRVP